MAQGNQQLATREQSLSTIRDLFRRTEDQIALALPKHMTAERKAVILRLKYLKRLYLKGPRTLVALLALAGNMESSWLATVVRDLQSLRLALASVDPRSPVAALPDPAVSPGAWSAYFKDGFAYWKAAIKHFDQHLCSVTKEEAAAALRAAPPAPPAPAEGRDPSCGDCGRLFPSRGALWAHAARAHGHRHPARKFTFGTSCVLCLREFWTRERCVHHLVRARCIDVISRVCVPLTDDEARQLDAAAAHVQTENVRAGKSSRQADRPATRLSGPRINAFFG